MDIENFLLQNRKFVDINPLVCGKQQCDPCHSFGPASRDYYLLHYVISGTGTFTADDKTYSLKPGECFVIFPYELTYYEADAESPWHYIWIGFECRIPVPKVFSERILSFRQLDEIFTRLDNMMNMETGREAFLCSQIWEIFSFLDSRNESSENRVKTYIEQAISCIENEYMMELSVQEIADRLNLNRSYFSTLFKLHTGISPQQYLLNFRLNKAAFLLQKHNYSVTQAALSTGYSDVFTFSKMFKKKFGVSPLTYQKQK
ncbi:AraC family transcriptional regulator [Scatolibacter rhodanostii]|uniref:AraC family transcriptional regulator n=1 Tax=Scatolibacter rhodanostii TaxID=2014781 RepID=UPI000C06B50D|nr:AraC family transcriptional regulator [Scatolibacter rhodanostii]